MKQTIFALGFFDGVHLGHQTLLQECRRLAARTEALAGAVTFGSHPDQLVLGTAPVLINTPADRERLLRQKLDRVVTLPFDETMHNTPWADFLTMLRRDYHAAGFVCGDDFRFGAQGRGNGALLAQYCREEGLPWAVVPEQSVHGIRVSSTYIRTLLEQGQLEEANAFLGHPHVFTGTVVHGHQLGRTLGIPTANLSLPREVASLRFGVYACQVALEGQVYAAVTNVGIRPTVEGEGILIEPWILDYTGDLYGREITLEFHHFLRPERKFPTLEALQAEIRRNANETRLFFKNKKESGQSAP